MRILEVRDGFIKFEAEKDISLASFIIVCDLDKNYVGQVIQIKRAGEFSIAYAKILYLYHEDFYDYDNSLPSKDAEIKRFDFKTVNKSFASKNSLVVGSFIEDDQQINVSKEFFNKKTLICVDNMEFNKTIISNLSAQFDQSLVIDLLGNLERKSVAGVDFKLPLNTEALGFIFEDCLNDATGESKDLIKEIFQDLSDYSKTVDFVPFKALKAIIDEMVDKSHIFKLLVLKNKLAKFDRLGYFAETVQEAKNLETILNSKNAVIDLSKLDPIFLNRYLSVVFSTLQKSGLNPQIFIQASNAINKKNLKTVLLGDFSTTLITHSRFKYINEIKSMFTSYIIEPCFSNNETFKKYSILLNAMQKQFVLIAGEITNHIPLISIVKELELENLHSEDAQLEEIAEDGVVAIELKETSVEEETSVYEDLEKDLEVDQSEEITVESEEETNESIQAIERKSEDLIERVAEEVQAETLDQDLNLFEDTESELVQEDSELIEEISEVVEEAPEAIVDEELELNMEEEISPIQEEVTESVEEITEELSEEDLEDVSSEIVSEEKSFDEFHTQVDEIKAVEVPEEISELAEIDTDVILNPNIEEEASLEVSDDSNEELQEYSEDLSVSSVSEDEESLLDVENEEFEAIVELDDVDLSDGDILVEIEEESDTTQEDELDKAIVEDVDKVFTTMKEDSISDSDLDFIDELNGNIEEEEIILSEGMEELTELQEVEEDSDEGFLEPLEEVNGFIKEDEEEREVLETKNTSTPMVPVYGADIPAEDLVMSDAIEQGDTVVHAKYGNGVVEKMIKYGTKTLYSINFDNVGRRLLDPTLTEIKKS